MTERVTPGEYASFVHYVERDDKTWTLAGGPAFVTSMRMYHAALGLSSEAGELASECKKALTSGRPIDVRNVLDECGDGLYYLTLALNVSGWTLEDAMRWNMAKLRRRHAHGKDKAAELELLRTFCEGIPL